jgi:hypothetical protein
MGKEMFIMYKIRQQKLPPNVDHDVVRVYNNMRARFKVQVVGHRWVEEKVEVPHEEF